MNATSKDIGMTGRESAPEACPRPGPPGESHAPALAKADFGQVADRFREAGFSVSLPEAGILQLLAKEGVPRRPRVLLSVGVHGDETAPIEMLAQVLEALAQEPHRLMANLMLAVGNPDAISQGKRFIDVDMNRLFRPDRGDLAAAAEAGRADALMRATASFFAPVNTGRWHLDLHAAIRPSHYETFAVLPRAGSGAQREALLDWLGYAGVGAAICNTLPAATYSAWTAAAFGAASATVELGQAAAFGSNDLSRFSEARAALDVFLRAGCATPCGRRPDMFRVAQEVIKQSGAFRMTVARDAWNFSMLPAGSVIAEDGERVYRVGSEAEYIVFPNPDVRPGLRAGLMLARM